ncbi:hypothetical protein Tco_0206257 [Tanacetum coccineum]
METKNTSSSGSDLEEPEIQKLQMQAKNLKENSLNKLNALKTTIQHLSSSNHSMYYKFREAFHRLFDANEGLFRYRFKSARFKRFNHRLQVQEMRQAVGLYQKKRLIRRNWKHITVQNNDENNVFANKRKHSEKNSAECTDERAALANLTLDTKENKTILKKLKKANASLTQEMEKCKTNLDETNRALGEATSCRDSCLIALQNKQNEFEKYKAFNDRTIDYDILQTKLNETLGLLARKDIDIKEGLKTKAYEISVVNQKHDELVKRSLLTKSQFEGQLKEKSKVISDLKVKEEKDIDKMIEMDKQLKFLNEIVYTRNQSIQTIHMLAPKCSTYNGRPTFANPRYLKKAQSEKPCLYEIPYDTFDLANRFGPNREETMTLANESRSKLNKDYVKPYDYTKQNSLYEIFKAPSLEYLYQLERAKEVRKTMWRKPFVRTKPNIAKNVAFLPVSKSISKSRQVFNDMTFNINHFRTICEQAWSNHTSSYFRVPTAQDMEVLIKTLLMPLSIKSQNDSFRFEHELKTEMHEDYEYVKSLEKEVDELESEKADFSNIYDLLLEECVSKDVTCSYLHSLSDLNAYAELQCLYLHKVKECECLAQKLSKQTESVNKEVHNKLLKSFAKLENHSISLELALQQCKEQMKNNSVCKENGSNVFRKEREQYHEIQDLKAQMQDKNIAISELKKLIEKCKGKSVETQFDKPSVVRQPNAQRIPKPSVLGKPTPFSNSPEMRSFQTKQYVVPTGRVIATDSVIVATSGYVVPAAYDISPGRDLKAQMQDKNIAISKLKKLIEIFKRKGVDTNFEQPSILGKSPVQSIRNQPVVRQPTAYKSERYQCPE